MGFPSEQMFRDIYKYKDISVFYLAILNCFFFSAISPWVMPVPHQFFK